MTFTIHRDKPEPRVVTFGPRVISIKTPPVETKPNQGAKHMGQDDLDVAVGVKTIRKDDADKQGAIGNDQNAAPKPPDGDVKLGNDKAPETGGKE